MTRIIRLLVVLAVVGAGMTAAISGVLAFEAQIVKVDARVSNAIGTTVDFGGTVLGGTDAAFPEEFIQDSVTVGLSADFIANSRFDAVTFDVVLQCASLRPGFAGGVHWMGDFIYISNGPPGAIKPGGPPGNGVTFGGDLPNVVPANLPWKLVGGAPLLAPPFSCAPLSVPHLTGQTMAIGGQTSRQFFFGIDVPVCEGSYNATMEDATVNQSGYLTPTLRIDPTDPRDLDGDCSFDAGMDLVFQVTGFTEATPVAQVSVTAPANVTSGSNFSARVNVTQVTDFDTAQFDVTFDPSVLNIVDITPGVGVINGDIGGTVIPIVGTGQIGPGIVRVLINVSGAPGVTGAGFLADINFNAAGPSSSSSSIDLTGLLLGNNVAAAIPSTAQGATVNIN